MNKWITDDPFLEIHFKQTKTNRAFLTEEELNILLKKEFTIPRLQTVRDIFVFCALTGLAFTDVQHLRYEHIIKDVNGEYWIRKAREKTDNMCDIPLLDIPRMILEKYKTHPECLKKGVVLPVPSNQRMNSYLKEIADICGINKPLSTHVPGIHSRPSRWPTGFQWNPLRKCSGIQTSGQPKYTRGFWTRPFPKK
mgnify:CR=1 FL=1